MEKHVTGRPCAPSVSCRLRPDHQVHGGAPVQRLGEQLEHQALVHAGVLLPQILAVAEQAGALAVLDHLGEDVHVGGELARLGAVAAVLVDAELDRVEVGDPDIDDELGPLRFLRWFWRAWPCRLRSGSRARSAVAARSSTSALASRAASAAAASASSSTRPASVCHDAAPRRERRHAGTDGANHLRRR